MRIAVLMLGSSLLGSTFLVSCSSHWKLREPLDTGCTDPDEYYFDGDGDGWGLRNSESEFLCVGDDNSGFTATNNKDCDDADQGITGDIQSGCPGGFGSDWAGVVHGDSEYIVVFGESDLRSSASSSNACGHWGGADGDLATFANDAEFTAVADAILQGVYAGFIGVEVDGASWAFTDSPGLNLGAYWCDSLQPEPTGHITERLALVRASAAGDWCIGQASMADGYDDNDAHYVCERPAPDPADY